MNPTSPDATTDALIRRYYACFNERRFRDAGSILTADALLENIPVGRQDSGVDGYVRFANTWIAAFPDGQFAVQRIDRCSDTMFEIHLLATGTHVGTFDIGISHFKATSTKARLRLRELLAIRNGHIAASTLTFDLNNLINQLSNVDHGTLLAGLERIHQLGEQLVLATGDAPRQREVTDRLGRELDAARKALRPHYYG